MRLYIERARLRRLLMERVETRESTHTWHDHDYQMIEYMNEDGMRTLARLLPFRGRDEGLDEGLDEEKEKTEENTGDDSEEKEQTEEDTEVKEDEVKEDEKMEN
jgi:hypothetical protein